MTCDEARRHWHLFHDSEGDAELHLRIEEHVSHCHCCAQWFDQESRLEDMIRDRLRADAPSEALWNGILSRVGLPSRPTATRSWMFLMSVAACLVLGFAVLSLGPFRGQGEGEGQGHHASSNTPNLAKLTLDWHERLIEGRAPVPYRSDSDRDVERYLRSRVSFPVRCPPRRDAGFRVWGTGVCDLERQPAAFHLGHVGDATVSIFVLPKESLAFFPDQRAALQREGRLRTRQGDYEMAATVVDQNLVFIIGRAEPTQLLQVLDAYGSYPEADSEAEVDDGDNATSAHRFIRQAHRNTYSNARRGTHS